MEEEASGPAPARLRLQQRCPRTSDVLETVYYRLSFERASLSQREPNLIPKGGEVADVEGGEAESGQPRHLRPSALRRRPPDRHPQSEEKKPPF